jgi:hypothetical protein
MGVVTERIRRFEHSINLKSTIIFKGLRFDAGFASASVPRLSNSLQELACIAPHVAKLSRTEALARCCDPACVLHLHTMGA